MLRVPGNKQSYRRIAIDDITFDNMTQDLCSSSLGAVDTGISPIVGLTDVILKLEDRHNAKGDCLNIGKLRH